jgi:hypothetical protein
MSGSSTATPRPSLNENDDELTRSLITLLDHCDSIPGSMVVTICRTNASRGRTIASMQESRSHLDTQLRACRQDLAVTKAALSSLSPTRGLLERLRNFLQAKEVKLLEDLETDYRALMQGDPCDIKPASSTTAFNPGERDAQQTIKTDAKKDHHGKRAWLPHLNTVSPSAQLSEAATRESRAATESFVSKEGATGTKRRAFDGDINPPKRPKTERDLDDLEPHAREHIVVDLKIKTEGESEQERVRVKTEE